MIRSDGRQYPIDVQWGAKSGNDKAASGRYLQPLQALLASRDLLVTTMCDAIEEGLASAPSEGDVLAFLPGVAEIRRVIEELHARGVAATILPLYGALAKNEQDRVLFPIADDANQQRIIVSSPIAEASLTLEGVTCVVDSGLRREPRCDRDTGMPRLVTTRCSKASATQRAGRAGRTQEGLCMRIYGQSEFDTKFMDHSPPEILCADLTPTVLLLSDWGCSRKKEILEELPFVDAPEEASLQKSIDLLVNLEALERKADRFVLTSHGRIIAKIPTHPRIAMAIAKATDAKTLAAAVAAAYLLDDEARGRGVEGTNLESSVRDLFQANSRTKSNILEYAARISDEATRAVAAVFDNKLSVTDVSSSLGVALLPGFKDLVAQRRGDASYGSSQYMLALGRSARLDGVRDAAEFVVVVDTSTGDDGTARIRRFAAVGKDALGAVAVERDTVFTVPSRGHKVCARRIVAVGILELSTTPLPTPPGEEASAVLLDAIRGLGGVNAALLQSLPKERRDEIEELRGRVRLARKLSSDEVSWPSCFAALDSQRDGSGTQTETEILEELVEPWLAAAGSLEEVNLLDALVGSLNPDQIRKLDEDLPPRIEAPDGSTIPLSYGPSGTPIASAKLQQFFGATETPSVGSRNNRIPVTLCLLSPAGKTLAQTVDLPFFWKETYPSVRAEMRGRYAKHPWPEDPISAVATRRTKKQEAAMDRGKHGR